MELYTTNEESGITLPIYISSIDIFSEKKYYMFRIIFVKSGTGILNINNKAIVFMAPVLFCINELDSIKLEKGCEIEGQVIYFSPYIINSKLTIDRIRGNTDEIFTNNISIYRDFFYLDPFIVRNEKLIGLFDIDQATYLRMLQLFKLLVEEITTFKNYYWPCRSRSFLLEILFLIQYIYTDYKTEFNLELINPATELNDIILYLHTNYAKKISINDLEKAFHINRTSLCKKFNEITGLSIINYLIKLRVKVATMLLRDTYLPISEITYRVGFNHKTYFTRTFKKVIGYSPSEYRKTMCQTIKSLPTVLH